MDAVDQGKVSLNDKVTLGRNDLTVFHQPIRDLILGGGSYTTTLSDLLVRAIKKLPAADRWSSDTAETTIDVPGIGAVRVTGKRTQISDMQHYFWTPASAVIVDGK